MSHLTGTPTRRESARFSSTPLSTRMFPSPRKMQQVQADIPIDPALLEEGTPSLNDLDDAEGEIVEDDIEDYGLIEATNRDEEYYQQPYLQPRASSSKSSMPPDDNMSNMSTPRKRGRPTKQRFPEHQTPYQNGDNFLHPPSHLISRSKGKGKGKGRPKGSVKMYPSLSGDEVQVVVAREDYCSFCMGTEGKNKVGQPERMVSCGRCGRSGHFSCLNMHSKELQKIVMSYDWHCIECKTCEICVSKGDDSRLMFCDGCDRGWHSYCLQPPLAKPPKGKWHCPICRGNHPSSTLPAKSPRPLLSSKSTPAILVHKGKGRTMDTPSKAHSLSTPSARPRKPRTPYTEEILDSQRPRIKVKPGRKKKTAEDLSDEEAFTPNVKIRLRVPSGGRRQTVEVESEEEKVPYGGVITGTDADTTKTIITDKDKEAFEKSRHIAETKLGGPPPETLSLETGSPAPSSMSNSQSYSPGPAKVTPAKAASTPYRPLRNQLLSNSMIGSNTPGDATPGSTSHATPSSISQKIKSIRFGEFDIDTWYSAPYPEEYQHVPDGRLWLCEFCLKYMKSGFVAGRHRMKCKARHPPGDEIYRKDTVSVFEVDGRKNKIYCQNLCLIAKMFLDHKTLYYDVEPFLFYVMTEVDDLGARFVGYFSKEKRSPDNNVSCIMTLPVRQRKGWGQLLIDFSYLLSKKEGRVGGPERPLSGLGEVAYKKYWQLAVFGFLRNSPDHPTIEDISAATSMTREDTFSTLKDESMIVEVEIPVQETPTYYQRRSRGRGRSRVGLARRQSRAGSEKDSDRDKVVIPEQYSIEWDRDYVEAVLKKHETRGYLTLAPERLKYHPFLVTRNPAKPPGAIAQATLMANNPNTHRVETSTPSREEEVVTPKGDEILAGEDQATLDLVKALAATESPKRNLRKRTSSEMNAALGSIGKRLRLGQNPKNTSSPRRSMRGAVQDYAVNGEEDSDSDDPLRLGRGMNGTPHKKRTIRIATSEPVQPPTPPAIHLVQQAEVIQVDEQGAIGEEDDADGEADGEYEDADAEGEDDEEYMG